MRYKYDVVRSARKSMSVEISSKNKITVRCSWFVTPLQIERFLDEKSEWIESKVLQNSRRLAQNDDVLELKEIYVFGKRVPLAFGGRAVITGDGVTVKKVEDLPKLFSNAYFAKFEQKVKDLAVKMKLYPNEISIKDYSSRWGCCDAKNNLIFNYRIFMLDESLQDYVIVHELCHTLCHNHSDAFWRLVAEYLPDYKKRKTSLKNFDFLVSLY